MMPMLISAQDAMIAPPRIRLPLPSARRRIGFKMPGDFAMLVAGSMLPPAFAGFRCLELLLDDAFGHRACLIIVSLICRRSRRRRRYDG